MTGCGSFYACASASNHGARHRRRDRVGGQHFRPFDPDDPPGDSRGRGRRLRRRIGDAPLIDELAAIVVTGILLALVCWGAWEVGMRIGKYIGYWGMF